MRKGFANPGQRLRREAERWFVKLLDADPRLPPPVEFERWLAADPSHAVAYADVERLWRLGEEAARHPDVVAVANRVLRSAPTSLVRQMRYWLTPALAVAAALIMFTGLVGYGWSAFAVEGTSTQYVTRVGQQRTVNLQDGSALLLDADSAVVVRFERDARRVALLHGRAEFRVRHDQHWPFVVNAAGGTVTDLGTTFQVQIGARDDVDVVLLEGKVSVATARARKTLTSGEALRFDRAGTLVGPYPADLSAALGWTSGEVVAHGWRLPRLLAEMNRYSDTKLELGDAGLHDVRVTGTFREGDQETLLRVLEAGWPIRAKRVSPTRVELLGKRGRD